MKIRTDEVIDREWLMELSSALKSSWLVIVYTKQQPGRRKTRYEISAGNIQNLGKTSFNISYKMHHYMPRTARIQYAQIMAIRGYATRKKPLTDLELEDLNKPISKVRVRERKKQEYRKWLAFGILFFGFFAIVIAIVLAATLT